MRDLHTLFWIAKYVYRVREPEELIEKGVSIAGISLVSSLRGFPLVRPLPHALPRRAPKERLSFDIQREIALRLGYTERPGLRDVERFMKHYLLIAKDVGDLTAILCAGLEDNQAKPMPVSAGRWRYSVRARAATLKRDRRFLRRLQPHHGR